MITENCGFQRMTSYPVVIARCCFQDTFVVTPKPEKKTFNLSSICFTWVATKVDTSIWAKNEGELFFQSFKRGAMEQITRKLDLNLGSCVICGQETEIRVKDFPDEKEERAT